MRIKRKISQLRRDMCIDMECECGQVIKNMSGYDDRYYHDTVIPSIECPESGKTANKSYRPLKTKYRDKAVV